MARKKPWEDFYDVTNMRYVHSHWRNFESIYEKNNISLSKTKDDGTFQKVIASVFLILEEQVKNWKALRDAFVKSGFEKDIFTSTDPKQALSEWNSMYQIYKEEKVYLGALHDVWDIQSEFSSLHKKGMGKKNPEREKAAQKYWNFISNKMTEAIDGFIAISHYIYENHSNAIQFMNAENYKSQSKIAKDSKAANVATPVIRAITGINDVLKSMGKESLAKDGLASLKKDLESAKNELLDTSTPWDQNKFELLDRFFTLFGRQNPKKYLEDTFGAPKWTDIKGDLFEVMIEDAFKDGKSNIIFIPDGERSAEKLKKQTTSDVLSFGFEYNSKPIRAGISLKTTAGGSFNTVYSPVDFINSPVFKEVESGLKSSNTVQWLRSNILSLNTFSLDDESGRLSSDGPKATATEKYLEEFLDFEEYITALMILPRVLDGVYEFQDNVTLKEFNEEVIYTALINMGDKFYWVADIAEQLINSFKRNGNLIDNTYYTFKAKKEKENVTSFKFSSSVKENNLKNFYNKKRAVLGKLNEVLYTKISESLQSEIDDLYSQLGSQTPIDKISITLKYGNLIKGGH